jgi:predicted chitinase
MAFGQTLAAGGKISKDSMNSARNSAILEARERKMSMKDQGLYNKEMAEAYVGMSDLAAGEIDGLNKAYGEQANTIKNATQAEEMEKFKQRLAETSNVFTQILAQSGLLSQLETAFDMLVGVTLDYVVPTFNFLADNFGTIVTIAAGLGATFLILNGIIMAAQVAESLKTLGISLSLAPLTAFAATLWAAVAPVLAAAAPFIAIAVAVGAAIYVFKRFGGDLEVVTDGLKYMWSGFKTFLTYLKLGFYKVLDSLPGVDYGKEIEETQQEISDQEKDREDLKDKMATRMAENRKKQEEEEKKENKESAMDAARKRIASREAEKADKTKADAAKKAADADKDKAAAAMPKDVGGGDPLKDIALYGKKRAEAAAQAAGSATGTPGATTAMTGGTPPPMNQDQKKNMDLIEASLKKQGITDPKYIAATKANVMKETGGKAIEENLNYGKTSNDRIRSIFGSRAAGKTDEELNAIKGDPSKMGEMMYGKDTKMGRDMGNTEAGDGFKYRGRGFIGLTGKANYSAASKAIYGDDRLVKNPDLVNDPQVAADVSAWFMKKSQGTMSKKLGIDTGNMTQEQANLLTTSQIAGQAITPGKGYLGGELLSKVNSYSAGFTGPGGASAKATPPTAVTPTQTAAAAAAGTRMIMVGNKSYVEGSAEHKAALEAEKGKSTATAQAPGAGAKTQETAESLLERLNMQVGELIAVTKDTRRVNERQLGVMADNSSNVFAMGA